MSLKKPAHEKIGNITPFGLRMPDELRERVRRHAEVNNRSMNAEIISLLEMALFEADMDRMNAGLEPLREMEPRDHRFLAAAREEIERRRAAEKDNAKVEDSDVPFFPETLTPDLFDKLFKRMDDRYQSILDEVRAINERFEKSRRGN